MSPLKQPSLDLEVSATDSGCGGRVIASLFFSVFLGMGLLFCVLLGRVVWADAQTWTWTQTPCRILSSTIRSDDGDHAIEVRYEYDYGGQLYEGSTYRIRYKGSTDYTTTQELVDRYSRGSPSTCYVNPETPGEAVLERNGLWMGLMMFIPLIFVVVGGGGIWGMWNGSSKSAEAPASISGQTQRKPVLVAMLFGVFAAAGLGTLYPFLIRPVTRVLDARAWPSVPCTVISSDVRSHSDSDGTTYSVDILYEYAFNNRTYRSNRFGFMGSSSSGYDGKYEIVRQYPPGRQTMCYVNPAAPAEAVLERGFTWDMLLGVIPVLFATLGLGGLVFYLRPPRAAGNAGGFVRPHSISIGSSARSDVGYRNPMTVLRPKTSAFGKAIIHLALAIFWNGLVSIFVYQAVMSWKRGNPEICLSIFLVPFVAVGLGIMGATIKAFMACFNPSVLISVDGPYLRLGDIVELRWECTGRYDRVGRLRIWLEGREEATYRQGTDTKTDKQTFAKLFLVDTVRSAEMAKGKAALAIPTDSMHTFDSANNKIVWAVMVHGEIAGWPDINIEYPISILPHAVQPKEAA